MNNNHLPRRYVLMLYSGLVWAWVIIPLQAQPFLTLEEVIQQVLAHNFEIQIARNKQKIADQNHRLGKADFLPVLDATVQMDESYQNKSQKYEKDTQLSTGIELKWSIFKGMQRIFNYQQLGKQLQTSQLDVQHKVEEKIAEAITGYYNLALAQKKKHILEDALSVAKEVLQVAKVKYEVGQCSKLEYLNAQVQHNEEQTKLWSQEEALTAARFTLYNLMSKDGLEEFAMVEDIPAPEKLSWGELEAAVPITNTSIRITQKRCEQAALAVKMKRADLWPQVAFSLGYNLGWRHDQRWEAKPRGFNYGVSISFNLFNAFRHATAIQEASILADNVHWELSAQTLQLTAELKKQFMHYTQQLQRYELAQEHVRVSQENRAVALEQYRLGSLTLLELNKARQNAQETELKVWDILYNTKVAEVALQKLSGTLLEGSLRDVVG